MQELEPQLIMRWKNDGQKSKTVLLPDGITVETFNERDTALDDWLDIVQYGLSEKRLGKEFYDNCMTAREFYDDKMCYFIVKGGEAIATITVICDYNKKEGYIHMVACKPECRGQGIGTLLNDIAVDTLKRENMQTAYLTTDDFRIPAIKSYLRCGFTPDLSTENFKDRWKKIEYEISKR